MLEDLGIRANNFGLLVLFIFSTLFMMGIIPTMQLKRFQKGLNESGIKNGAGQVPKAIAYWKKDKYYSILKVNASGVGAFGLNKSKEKLEASFGIPIEEIVSSKNPKYAEIILAKRDLPTQIGFNDLKENLSSSGSFLIGESKKGIITSEIDKLPHMLIAGSTGSGKSVYFKQALLGLLKSTNHLQMYLIDLKGGLEFRCFNKLPNVKVVKTVEESVALLESVKEEMEARFDYLEQKEKLKINPVNDRKDRIIVSIDEASVLYANARKDSDDHDLIIKARDLTEHIAKLSRAAAIHLIFATQKVTKETIDTRIQENISGRMCFKLNTVEGSVRVLGDGKACALPNNPGRGIWQLGNEKVIVQAPNIENEDLENNLVQIERQYSEGEKNLFQQMLMNHPPSEFNANAEKLKESLVDA